MKKTKIKPTYLSFKQNSSAKTLSGRPSRPDQSQPTKAPMTTNPFKNLRLEQARLSAKDFQALIRKPAGLFSASFCPGQAEGPRSHLNKARQNLWA
jgi:hypothetical protein